MSIYSELRKKVIEMSNLELSFSIVLLILLTVRKSKAFGDYNISGKILCDDTKMTELDNCWNKLPQEHDGRIPSDRRKIESACRIFDAGIKCMENWTKDCLQTEDQEKIESSVVGAVGIYKSLCSTTDVKFREEFLQHADCYDRISPHWETCTKKFSNTLKKINHGSDVLSLCCVRIRYTQCVNKGANSLCTTDASKFIENLAKSLMESTSKNYHSSRCSNISHKQCSSAHVSSAEASGKLFLTFLVLLFPHAVLSVVKTRGMNEGA